MIRLPKSEQLKINVYLKDGKRFIDNDITNQPFGEHEKIISFWHNDKIRCYPIEAVEYWELYEDLTISN